MKISHTRAQNEKKKTTQYTDVHVANFKAF